MERFPGTGEIEMRYWMKDTGYRISTTNRARMNYHPHRKSKPNKTSDYLHESQRVFMSLSVHHKHHNRQLEIRSPFPFPIHFPTITNPKHGVHQEGRSSFGSSWFQHLTLPRIFKEETSISIIAYIVVYPTKYMNKAQQ